MASLKCSFCGNGIHYHGIPDGTEYVMIKEKDWYDITKNVFDPNNKISKNNYPMLFKSDTMEDEFSEFFIKFWMCKKCETIALLNPNDITVDKIYVKSENENKNILGERYFVFSDIDWDKITEDSIPISQILNKYSPTYIIYMDNMSLSFMDFKNDAKVIKHYVLGTIAEE